MENNFKKAYFFSFFFIYLGTQHLGMMIPIGYYQVNPSYFPPQVAGHQTFVSLPQSSSSKQTESKTKSQTKLYIQFRPNGGDVRAETELVSCLIYLGVCKARRPDSENVGCVPQKSLVAAI